MEACQIILGNTTDFVLRLSRLSLVDVYGSRNPTSDGYESTDGGWGDDIKFITIRHDGGRRRR